VDAHALTTALYAVTTVAELTQLDPENAPPFNGM
jgi:hypothetical protein